VVGRKRKKEPRRGRRYHIGKSKAKAVTLTEENKAV